MTDAAEEEAIDEMKQTARKELEDWYRHRDEQLEKTKATNRYHCLSTYLCSQLCNLDGVFSSM